MKPVTVEQTKQLVESTTYTSASENAVKRCFLSSCKLLKIWSGRPGSNRQPTAWKAVTLPLSYSRTVDRYASIVQLPPTIFNSRAESAILRAKRDCRGMEALGRNRVRRTARLHAATPFATAEMACRAAIRGGR